MDLGRSFWRLAGTTLLILAIGSLGCAHATSTYTYGEKEYVVVAGGTAPDHRYAIAAHGSGDYGSDEFHLYLLAEPGGKVIGPLEEVTGFDTGPQSYTAVWSPDSRYVGVLYRGDRHIVALNLYRIEHGRAFPLSGPTPLLEAASGADIDLRSSHLELAWQADGRFALKEESTFKPGPAGIGDKLGKFTKAEPNETDGTFMDFSAVAICELAPGDRYRIVELKPGPVQP
jgi:hypothetical protein